MIYSVAQNLFCDIRKTCVDNFAKILFLISADSKYLCIILDYEQNWIHRQES